MQKFNLKISSGEWVAVVGSSGSSKSTLAKIVTGLYEEWSGKILFDGVERKNLPRAVILNSLAAVDQDIFLITGTIAENILLFLINLSVKAILFKQQKMLVFMRIL